MRFQGLAAAIPPGVSGSSSPLILLKPPRGIQFKVNSVPGLISLRIPLKWISPGWEVEFKFCLLQELEQGREQERVWILYWVGLRLSIF